MMWYCLSSVIKMSSMDCCRPRSAIVRSLACTTLLLPAAATSRSRSIGLPAVPSAMPLLLSTRATPSAPSICMASLRAVEWSFMGGSLSGGVTSGLALVSRFHGDGGHPTSSGGRCASKLSLWVVISEAAATSASDLLHQAILADSISAHSVSGWLRQGVLARPDGGQI